YRCPVVYCEPYVMNSKDAFARIQAGDYEGTRTINGIERKSIYREYADSVVDGLVDYYLKARCSRDRCSRPPESATPATVVQSPREYRRTLRPRLRAPHRSVASQQTALFRP